VLLIALAIAFPLLGIFYALIPIYEALTNGRVTFRVFNHFQMSISHPSEMEVSFSNPKTPNRQNDSTPN